MLIDNKRSQPLWGGEVGVDRQVQNAVLVICTDILRKDNNAVLYIAFSND